MDAGSELRRLLVEELCEIMEGWTQCDAALLLGLRQPHVSRLRRGVTDGFSVDRLVRLIAICGRGAVGFGTPRMLFLVCERSQPRIRGLQNLIMPEVVSPRRPLRFKQIAFIDMKDLAALHRGVVPCEGVRRAPHLPPPRT
jgi:hypothetical protein